MTDKKKAEETKFGIQSMKNELSLQSKDFLKDIQSEMVKEEHDALRDFIKGGYRLLLEKEQELEALTSYIEKLRSAIEKAGAGDWEEFQKIKIPARFFKEETLRKHGKSLIEGSEEIRFVELYDMKK